MWTEGTGTNIIRIIPPLIPDPAPSGKKKTRQKWRVCRQQNLWLYAHFLKILQERLVLQVCVAYSPAKPLNVLFADVAFFLGGFCHFKQEQAFDVKVKGILSISKYSWRCCRSFCGMLPKWLRSKLLLSIFNAVLMHVGFSASTAASGSFITFARIWCTLLKWGIVCPPLSKSGKRYDGCLVLST